MKQFKYELEMDTDRKVFDNLLEKLDTIAKEETAEEEK